MSNSVVTCMPKGLYTDFSKDIDISWQQTLHQDWNYNITYMLMLAFIYNHRKCLPMKNRAQKATRLVRV